MSDSTFYDLMTTDPLQWGLEVDPIGLLSYQNHKRKQQFYVEDVEDIQELKKMSPQQRTDFERVMHGAMKRDEYDKKWKVGKHRPKGNPLAGPGGLYKNLVKEEEDAELNEVLTLQQRMRRKIIMRRIAPRLARARKISMRRRAGNDVLKRRAKSLARKTMAKKLLGGRNKADVSPSERARIEKILAKRKGAIDRIATRLLPVVRKKQAMRFAAKKAPVKKAPEKKAPAPAASTSSASSNK